jgi:membrane protease YdiL (CAAX protease family)
MSTSPEPVPSDPEETPSGEPSPVPASDPLGPANAPAPPGEWAGEPEEPNPRLGTTSELAAPDLVAPEFAAPPPAEEILTQPIFVGYTQTQPALRPREVRIPNFGHLFLLILLGIFGWLGAGILLLFALRIHLWGISNLTQAATDFHYTLASQAAQYLITFAACLAVFPIVWHKSFFDGIHWSGLFAWLRAGRLVSAAVLCFFVAMINGMLMPGPTNAPIDELFRAPGAAWVLFAFGVTLAPFFEEMAFRGFLLPSLCTAWDWTNEHITGAPRRPLDQDGHPQWSLAAMLFGSVVTSVPFALMHGAQTSWSLGPFLLLIFVSLVFCWVRLSTRSLAASTMVHACYNFMLFLFMMLGTGGFKHLDKM